MFTRFGRVDAEKAIIAYPRGIRTPFHVSLSGKYISRNKQGKNALPEGMFVSKKNGEHRFLPRARVIAPTSGSRIKVGNPYCFVPGDVLEILNPSAMLTVSGVGEAGITFNNQTFKYVPVGAANATEAATILAAHFNRIPNLSKNLEFIATGANLYVYSPAGRPLATFTPSGTLGSTVTTTAANTVPVGTVSSIDPLTEEIVLGSAVVGTLPVGSSIGVPQDEVLGIFPHSIDFTEGGVTGRALGVVHKAYIYKLHLPYYDNSLVYECPDLEAREVWS